MNRKKNQRIFYHGLDEKGSLIKSRHEKIYSKYIITLNLVCVTLKVNPRFLILRMRMHAKLNSLKLKFCR